MSVRYQTLIEADDVIRNFQKEKVLVLDCRFYLDDVKRGRKEFLISHIPRAVYMDTNHDLSSPVIKGVTGRHPLPHRQILAATLRAAGMENNTQVIAYDQSNGAYAARAWWLLNWLGHENVAVLNGGFNAWTSIQGPLDNQWWLPSPGHFEPKINEELVTPMNELQETGSLVIDSREYSRFTGEFEPIDPVAGHIPGAICMPFMENTLPSGRWKTKSELEERFSGLSDEKTPVFYCGSGVTACHNILAYKKATGKNARLYPGSWSEWINYHKL